MKSVRGKNKMTRGGAINHTDNALLLNKAKVLVTQRILGSATFILIGLMIFNTMKMTFAGNSNTANLNLNVTAGVLEILNSPTDVKFPDSAQGVAANITQMVNGITVSDWRSTSNFFWDLNIYANNMVGTDTNYVIPNTIISVRSNSTDKTNVNSYDTATLGNGVGERAVNGDNVFFNSEDTSGGVVRLDNLQVKVNLNSSLIGQAYLGAIVFTVVAS